MVAVKVAVKAVFGSVEVRSGPGTTNVGSPVESSAGAAAYGASGGGAVDGGAGVELWMVVTAAPTRICMLPPVRRIDDPAGAQLGKERKNLTRVSLPRASRGYDPSPWLTETSR